MQANILCLLIGVRAARAAQMTLPDGWSCSAAEHEEIGFLQTMSRAAAVTEHTQEWSGRPGKPCSHRLLPNQNPRGKTVKVTLKVTNGFADPFGVNRSSVLINASLYGALNQQRIEADEGDLIEVDFVNGFFSQGTTVHWHGMHQQATNAMDGVDGVTQCPFAPGQTFKYKFVAYPAGTHWWHSHDGVQYADGLAGPMIFHRRQEKKPAEQSEEIVVFLGDWSPGTGTEEFLTALTATSDASVSMSKSGSMPSATTVTTTTTWGDIGDTPFYGVLANGEGLIRMETKPGDTTRGSGAPTLAQALIAKDGKSKRLRFICGMSNQMFVVNLPFVGAKVIAVDGQPIKPYGPVKSFQCAAGDRIDVQVPAGGIRNAAVVMSVSSVDGAKESVVTLHPDRAIIKKGPTAFWSVSGKCDSSGDAFDNTCISLMYDRGLQGATAEYEEKFPVGKPDKSFKMTLGGSMADPYLWWINAITFAFPYPALFESGGASAVEVTTDGSNSWSTGTQILEADTGDVVDFLIINDSGMYHPFHLHGYSFWVLGAGPEGTVPTEPPAPAHPVLKDNQNVPAKGWVWLRVKADNPGFWIFHCHIDFHLATGMDLVLKVGSSAEILWKNPVSEGFVKCAGTK